MKAKKIVTLALAALMAAAATISVSAEPIELTEKATSGQTEVRAHINGKTPGDVSYIVEIPDVIDFGELVIPENDSEDHFADQNYTVTAKEINGLDTTKQQVSVYVRDKGATVTGDQDFWIANTANSNVKFSYDVYDTTTVSATYAAVNSNTFTGSVGYLLTSFVVEGEAVNGILRLNQNQLLGTAEKPYTITDLVGDYTGYMVFYTMIEDIPNP